MQPEKDPFTYGTFRAASLPLPERMNRADGKADQTDLCTVFVFGIGGDRRTRILAV